MELITHNGEFHADDVCSYVILKALYPDATLIRTRDKELLADKPGRIVFDVGGGQFDHHNKELEFKQVSIGDRKYAIPFASFGRIWRFGGIEYIDRILKAKKLESNQKIVTHMAFAFDGRVVNYIDATDNGIELLPDGMCNVVTSLSSIISSFNPTHMECNSSIKCYEAFERAAKVAETTINRQLLNIYAEEMAYKIVADTIKNTKYYTRYVILPRALPWQQHLLEIDKAGEILYVIFKTQGEYRVQAVPQSVGSFYARKMLPQDMWGKGQQELNAIMGAKDMTFCHSTGFICGCKTKDTAIKIAERAIKY